MATLLTQTRKTPNIRRYVLCAFAIYVGLYITLVIMGWFELARLPWGNPEHGLLYKLFVPLEWLRRMLQG